jgi:hypothetical protein
MKMASTQKTVPSKDDAGAPKTLSAQWIKIASVISAYWLVELVDVYLYRKI